MTYALSAIFLELEGSCQEGLERVRKHIDACGFRVLHIAKGEVPAELRLRAEEHLVRLREGAEWTHIIFCLDHNPRPAGARDVDLDNVRVLQVIGVDIGEGKAFDSHRTAEIADALVGWTRGTREAWAVARAVCPEHYVEMREAVLETVDALLPPFAVVRDLSVWGIHARVFLVRHKGRLAVCKIFRSGYPAGLKREARALALSQQIDGIPKLIMAKDNWVLMEYLEGYEELKPGRLGFLPIKLVRKAFSHLRALHEAGFFMLDFHPGNVIAIETDARIIDYEHCFEYPVSIPPFEESPPFMGAAYFSRPDVAEEIERTGSRLGKGTWYPSYEKTWKPVLGVELNTLLYGGWASVIWERAKYLVLVKIPRRIRRKLSQRHRAQAQ